MSLTPTIIEAGANEATAVDGAAQPLVPRAAAARDHILPILIGASLIVHATVFLPSLMRDRDDAPARPKEISVELVQLPPQPKTAAAKPPAPKPPPKVAEAQPKQAPKPPPKSVEKPASKSVAERMKDLLGPMPAIAMPASAADGSDAASYTQLVLSKVAKAKKEGRYAGIPAAASVSFRLGDSGEVASVEIVRPSGDPSLDAEAIAMIKRGAPYPPPPPGGRRDYTITLRFQAVT